jgi:hypothetical protein
VIKLRVGLAVIQRLDDDLPHPLARQSFRAADRRVGQSLLHGGEDAQTA